MEILHEIYNNLISLSLEDKLQLVLAVAVGIVAGEGLKIISAPPKDYTDDLKAKSK